MIAVKKVKHVPLLWYVRSGVGEDVTESGISLLFYAGMNAFIQIVSPMYNTECKLEIFLSALFSDNVLKMNDKSVFSGAKMM